MIRITIHTEGPYISGFTAEGHSGYAPSGSDIVCAAVSALAITAANSLEQIVGIGADAMIQDGFMNLTLPEQMHPTCREKADIIMRSACIGFRSVAEQYPEYVSILNGGAKK